MLKNTFIFVPNTLEKDKVGCLEGFYKHFDDCDSYYITSNKVLDNTTHCIGFVSSKRKVTKIQAFKGVHIDSVTNKITINDENNKKYCIVKVVYDYIAFKNSKVLHLYENHYGDHFKLLIENLGIKKQASNNKNGRRSILTYLLCQLLLILGWVIKLFNRINHYMPYSATISHFKENLETVRWLLSKSVNKNETNLKSWNTITAKLLDLIIGIFLVKCLFEYEQNVLYVIEDTREIIIKNLRELLTYLMGSPIGLKLNYAFNKSLGKFFFYHITLWRVFLFFMQPFLMKYYKYFVLPGIFGFSFQIAMFSDIIAIATFHVYCIYVYAARLFYFQLKALCSLWRLFIGRKYNPLRDRVDSYQYSQHQLFIGTLGFTILLFLLPTTIMYYTVFTTLRLGIIIIDAALYRFRYVMNCLPVYVLTLWIMKSQKLAGTLHLHWRTKNNEDCTVLDVKLNTLPLSMSVKEFIQETITPLNSLSWSNIFHNIITGLLI